MNCTSLWILWIEELSVYGEKIVKLPWKLKNCATYGFLESYQSKISFLQFSKQFRFLEPLKSLKLHNKTKNEWSRKQESNFWPLQINKNVVSLAPFKATLNKYHLSLTQKDPQKEVIIKSKHEQKISIEEEELERSSLRKVEKRSAGIGKDLEFDNYPWNGVDEWIRSGCDRGLIGIAQVMFIISHMENLVFH